MDIFLKNIAKVHNNTTSLYLVTKKKGGDNI